MYVLQTSMCIYMYRNDMIKGREVLVILHR